MTALPRFDRQFFQGTRELSRIGEGEIGGKASGLLKAAQILQQVAPEHSHGGLRLRIPKLAVIATDFFDEFLALNNLRSFLSSEHSDQRIAHAFQKGSLPVGLLGDLRAIAQEAHSPLAVRSSSLLEDRIFRPFAGVYATKMTPNNQPAADQRFQKLTEAVKFVWASTFFCEARSYRRSCGLSEEEEKMAVIIQEVVGARHGSRYYPLMSGVARSFNFYPMGKATPAEGVVNLALGLGKTIVDGGLSWSYSPEYPLAPPPWGSVSDMLKNSQTRFWAVNMGELNHYDPVKEDEFLIECDLAEAEYDNTLKYIASTYDSGSDRIVPGTGRAGPRLLNFAPVLDMREPPLNDLLREVVSGCEKDFGTEVEIEFAVSLDDNSPETFVFSFLQVRPMVVSALQVDVSPDACPPDKRLLYSERVLGNGHYQNISDIVYVRPEAFNAGLTPQIALQIESINTRLMEQGRNCLLIGFGRWGSSDPWLGIPVVWSQISSARVIVEAQIPGMSPDLSQGSHFFHNLTSFQVSYFSVPQNGEAGLNWDLIAGQVASFETDLVRHVALPRPLEVRVDGRSGRGVIILNG